MPLTEVRRDQWDRYLVVPPAGGLPEGYTRATTVAKALDDGGGLIPWKAAVAMTGMMRRPGLRGRFEALLSAHPDRGPWYGSPESKTEVKRLVEECAEAGGSSDRADVGTALHAIVEQVNRGNTPTISQDSTRADLDAYTATLTAHGITLDRNMLEVTVVLDAWKVAGTADVGAAHVPHLGWVIADLKTGTNLDYSWQSIAVQLAIYAHGDNVYRQGPATDGTADERLPVPNVRQDVAVVIHLPAGEGRCVLYEINIAAGWEAFERSMWARKWRGRRDLASPITAPATPPFTIAPETIVSLTETVRRELLAQVRSMPADRQQMLKDSWPADMPPLARAGEHWTAERLEKVARVVTQLCGSPGPEASAADATPPVVPTREAAGDDESVASGDPAQDPGVTTAREDVPAGDPPPAVAPGQTYMSVEAWQKLDRDERARLIERGHLPPELRTPPEQLIALHGRVKLLPDDLQQWCATEASTAGLPHIKHPAQWTKTRGDRLRRIIEAAEEHAGQYTDTATADLAIDQITIPVDWAALIAEAGLTKAAVQRRAKELGAEIGFKVPSVIERYPTEGPFALGLARWIGEQTKASTAA